MEPLVEGVLSNWNVALVHTLNMTIIKTPLNCQSVVLPILCQSVVLPILCQSVMLTRSGGAMHRHSDPAASPSATQLPSMPARCGQGLHTHTS